MDDSLEKWRTGIPSLGDIKEFFINQFVQKPLDEYSLYKLVEFREIVAGNIEWRENLQIEIYRSFCDLAFRIMTCDELGEDDPLKYLLLAEVFRFVRNTCPYSESNQVKVGLQTGLGSQTIDFIRTVIKTDGEGLDDGSEKVIAVQCAIQATCNSLTGCKTVCDYYVDVLKYVEDLVDYVDHPVNKLAYYSTITLLELYKMYPIIPLSSESSEDCGESNAYSDLFLEALCRFPEFFKNNFNKLPREVRLHTLDNLTNCSNKKYQRKMTLPVLLIIMELYKANVETFVSNELSQITDEMIEEVNSLLALMLTLASLEEEKLPHMQADEKFLVHTVGILSKVHKLGKLGNNCFTPVEKLDFVAATGPGSQEIDNHPTFRLKMRLIALLTYLSCTHEVNQNIIRTHDGLSVILECTKIDARNPYLPQYAILAIRTLLEQNQENQNFVKQMDKQGFGDSSVLKEFGIQLKDSKGPEVED